MIRTDHNVHFATGHNTKKKIKTGTAKAKTAPGRVPHVAKLMALAIRLDQLIRDGQVTDQAELARLSHVSRARLTQIMNLLHVAPDIQEELLFLPKTAHGRDPVTERDLRPIAAEIDWGRQRQKRQRLRSGSNVAGVGYRSVAGATQTS